MQRLQIRLSARAWPRLHGRQLQRVCAIIPSLQAGCQAQRSGCPIPWLELVESRRGGGTESMAGAVSDRNPSIVRAGCPSRLVPSCRVAWPSPGLTGRRHVCWSECASVVTLASRGIPSLLARKRSNEGEPGRALSGPAFKGGGCRVVRWRVGQGLRPSHLQNHQQTGHGPQ